MAESSDPKNISRKVSEFFLKVLEKKLKEQEDKCDIYYDLLRGFSTYASDDIKNYVKKKCKGEDLFNFFKARRNYFEVDLRTQNVRPKSFKRKRKVVLSDDEESTRKDDDHSECRVKSRKKTKGKAPATYAAATASISNGVSSVAGTDHSRRNAPSESAAFRWSKPSRSSSVSSASTVGSEDRDIRDSVIAETAKEFFCDYIEEAGGLINYRDIQFLSLPKLIKRHLKKYTTKKILMFFLDNPDAFCTDAEGMVSLTKVTKSYDSDDDRNSDDTGSVECDSSISDLTNRSSCENELLGKRTLSETSNDTANGIPKEEALAVRHFVQVLKRKSGHQPLSRLVGHLSQVPEDAAAYVNAFFHGDDFKKLFMNHRQIFRVSDGEVSLAYGYQAHIDSVCTFRANERRASDSQTPGDPKSRNSRSRSTPTPVDDAGKPGVRNSREAAGKELLSERTSETARPEPVQEPKMVGRTDRLEAPSASPTSESGGNSASKKPTQSEILNILGNTHKRTGSDREVPMEKPDSAPDDGGGKPQRGDTSHTQASGKSNSDIAFATATEGCKNSSQLLDEGVLLDTARMLWTLELCCLELAEVQSMERRAEIGAVRHLEAVLDEKSKLSIRELFREISNFSDADALLEKKYSNKVENFLKGRSEFVVNAGFVSLNPLSRRSRGRIAAHGASEMSEQAPLEALYFGEDFSRKYCTICDFISKVSLHIKKKKKTVTVDHLTGLLSDGDFELRDILRTFPGISVSEQLQSFFDLFGSLFHHKETDVSVCDFAEFFLDSAAGNFFIGKTIGCPDGGEPSNFDKADFFRYTFLRRCDGKRPSELECKYKSLVDRLEILPSKHCNIALISKPPEADESACIEGFKSICLRALTGCHLYGRLLPFSKLPSLLVTEEEVKLMRDYRPCILFRVLQMTDVFSRGEGGIGLNARLVSEVAVAPGTDSQKGPVGTSVSSVIVDAESSLEQGKNGIEDSEVTSARTENFSDPEGEPPPSIQCGEHMEVSDENPQPTSLSKATQPVCSDNHVSNGVEQRISSREPSSSLAGNSTIVDNAAGNSRWLPTSFPRVSARFVCTYVLPDSNEPASGIEITESSERDDSCIGNVDVRGNSDISETNENRCTASSVETAGEGRNTTENSAPLTNLPSPSAPVSLTDVDASSEKDLVTTLPHSRPDGNVEERRNLEHRRPPSDERESTDHVRESGTKVIDPNSNVVCVHKAATSPGEVEQCNSAAGGKTEVALDADSSESGSGGSDSSDNEESSVSQAKVSEDEASPDDPVPQSGSRKTRAAEVNEISKRDVAASDPSLLPNSHLNIGFDAEFHNPSRATPSSENLGTQPGQVEPISVPDDSEALQLASEETNYKENEVSKAYGDKGIDETFGYVDEPSRGQENERGKTESFEGRNVRSRVTVDDDLNWPVSWNRWKRGSSTSQGIFLGHRTVIGEQLEKKQLTSGKRPITMDEKPTGARDRNDVLRRTNLSGEVGEFKSPAGDATQRRRITTHQVDLNITSDASTIEGGTKTKPRVSKDFSGPDDVSRGTGAPQKDSSSVAAQSEKQDVVTKGKDAATVDNSSPWKTRGVDEFQPSADELDLIVAALRGGGTIEDNDCARNNSGNENSPNSADGTAAREPVKCVPKRVRTSRPHLNPDRELAEAMESNVSIAPEGIPGMSAVEVANLRARSRRNGGGVRGLEPSHGHIRAIACPGARPKAQSPRTSASGKYGLSDDVVMESLRRFALDEDEAHRRRLERHERRKRGKAEKVTAPEAEVSNQVYRGSVVFVAQNMCLVEVVTRTGDKRNVACMSEFYSCAKHRDCAQSFASLSVGTSIQCTVLPPCAGDNVWVASSFRSALCVDDGDSSVCSDSSSSARIAGGRANGRDSSSRDGHCSSRSDSPFCQEPPESGDSQTVTIASCPRCSAKKVDVGLQVGSGRKTATVGCQTFSTGGIFQTGVYHDEE